MRLKMDQLSYLVDVLIPIVTSVIGFLVGLIRYYKEVKELSRSLRDSKTIIAVVNTEIPDSLKKYRDFTDLKKAERSSETVVVLHCRSLSYALRHCDFVCAIASDDVKIHAPNDAFWTCFEDQ